MIKSLTLSIFSSLSILTGIASSLMNSKLETKYNQLINNSFLKITNPPTPTKNHPSHSAWNLILNSGSFSYLTKLVHQLQIENSSDSDQQVSSAGNFSNSSELYTPKLRQLVNEFLSDLKWTHLIEVLEDRQRPSDNSEATSNPNHLNNSFPQFKSNLLIFNQCLELSIFMLIIWALSCISLASSSIFFCSKYNSLEKYEKVKWLIYHLITQFPGWIFKYRKQLSKLGRSDSSLKSKPLFSGETQAFSISNLSYSIGSAAILKNINLNLQKNEFYAIIGANGAGKTTLLKHLGKLIVPKEGHLFLGSKELHSCNDRDFWTRVTYIPQELSIPPDTPVYDFLLSCRYLSMNKCQRASKEDHLKVLYAIKRCQIERLRWSKIGALSGGQRQKVILASILVKDADLILLDEPTTFLDIDNRNFLVSFFKDLHSSGKTIIANLHQFSEINRLATKVIAMKEGKLLKMDEKEKLLNSSFLNLLYDLNLSAEKWDSLMWSSKFNY